MVDTWTDGGLQFAELQHIAATYATIRARNVPHGSDIERAAASLVHWAARDASPPLAALLMAMTETPTCKAFAVLWLQFRRQSSSG